jgi:hypothetical protein
MAKKSKADIIIPMDKMEESTGGRPYFKGEPTLKCKIIKVEKGNSKDKGTPYVRVHLRVMEGKFKGKKTYEDLYITPKALQRIRDLLKACGINVPKKRFKFPMDRVVGKVVGVEFQDDDYEDNKGNTRTTSRVAFDGFMAADDIPDEDEDEDEDEDDDDLEEDDDDEEEEEEDDDIDLDDEL